MALIWRKMKYRAVLSMMLAAVIVLFLPSSSLAQTAPTGACNGEQSPHGSYTVSPDFGPAGSQVALGGTIPLFPGLQEGLTSMVGPDMDIWWYGTGSAAPVFMKVMPTEWNGVDTATLAGTLEIPADAAAGPHNIGITFTGMDDPDCVLFTVTEPVGQDAYPGISSRLPDTGLPVAAPVAGLLMGGALYLSRRRRAR